MKNEAHLERDAFIQDVLEKTNTKELGMDFTQRVMARIELDKQLQRPLISPLAWGIIIFACVLGFGYLFAWPQAIYSWTSGLLEVWSEVNWPGNKALLWLCIASLVWLLILSERLSWYFWKEEEVGL